MRRIVAVVLVLVLLLAAAVWAVYLADKGAGPVTTLEQTGLVGPVHQVKERSYSIEPGDESLTEDALWDKTMKTFDRNGNMTESIVYGLNDFVAKKTTFEYDESGYLSEIVFMSPEGNIKSRSVSEYDAKKGISFIKVYDADGALHHLGEVIYDDRGLVVETKTLTIDGELAERVVYHHNEAGHQVGEDIYDRSRLAEAIVRVFAANGELSRIEAYDADGMRWLCSESTDALVYDDVGNWVRRETTRIDCPKGKSGIETMSVTFRDITYYD